MKKFSMVILIFLMSFIYIFSGCNQGRADKTVMPADSTQTQTALPPYGGFGDEVAWGKHIVAIVGCNDCHTPNKMGPSGPEPNLDLELSGSPSQMPKLSVNRKDTESKGYMVIGNNLAFDGPWGVSYAANITSDTTTGIGTWTEDQFVLCMRKGKYAGAPQGRNLLPPMPWPSFAQMTDDELKAVYSYLESTKPIHNIVPEPQPPALAMKK